MGLADLLAEDFGSDATSSDDASFDPLAAEQCVEVAEDESESEEDPVEEYFTPQPGENGISPRWPARLRALLSGSLEGGDPASSTGLLVGVAPMLLHKTQSPHPERPARVVAIYHELFEQELVARARLVPARLASNEDLALVHDRKLVRGATATYDTDEDATAALGIDSDTYFRAKHSGYAARLSAGSVVELATRMAQGELCNALAVTRPPGHHCEQHQSMGFCLLNNVPVAVAALRARLGVRRVLVVDWDVHHGNGTQHMFDDDPLVLYLSLHRYGLGFYPGTGAPEEVGEGGARGKSVNMAFRQPGMGDAEYRLAFERLVMPIAREFEPEFVFVSAGFDAAYGDPLGGMVVSPAGYAYMTEQLCSLAQGRVLVALEGGYNLTSISRSACAVMRVLLGEAASSIGEGGMLAAAPHPAACLDVDLALRCQAPYWRCVAEQAVANGTLAVAGVVVAGDEDKLLYRSLGEVTWRTGAPLKGEEGEQGEQGEQGEEGEDEELSLFPSGLYEEDALAMSRAGPPPGSATARSAVFKRKQPWAARRQRGPAAWWWRSKQLGLRLF